MPESPNEADTGKSAAAAAPALDEGEDDHNASMADENAGVIAAPTLMPPFPSGQHQQQHAVSYAVYSLAPPLRARLVAGIVTRPTNHAAARVDTFQHALTCLVDNSVEALDVMFFGTAARIRQRPEFTHRTCLRIATNRPDCTVTITDLGTGMTRADVINRLGIGRTTTAMVPQHPHHNGHPQNGNGNGGATATETDSTDNEEDDDENDDTATDSADDNQQTTDTATDDDNDDNDDNDGESPSTAPAVPTDSNSNVVVSCLAADIGGFYGALCALATGARVGTKSKHDDYYEFEVGNMSNDSPTTTTTTAASFDHFVVRRPLPEGTALTVATPGGSFAAFASVRGISGTSVTLRLNDAAVHAGLLDENILKPMFLKIVETTQYTVAFSSDEEQAREIIAASELERVMMEQLLAAPLAAATDGDLSDAAADLDITGGSSNRGSGRSSQHHLNDDDDYHSVKERAKYIPLRLSLGERKMLRLVEASMVCCDYTSTVDRPFKSVARRTHEQLKYVTAVLRGLVTACDYAAGQGLLRGDDDDDDDDDDQDSSFAKYQSFFRQMMEIARRHKIMNPEKMRTEYGKLIYLLQDAVSPTVQPHLGFSIKCPIESVYKFLEERNGLGLLSDKLIETATEEILAERKTRAQIDAQIRAKEKAVRIVKQKYRTNLLSSDDIHLCLYSICDNNSFLNSNRVPIDKVIDFLTSHFSPSEPQFGYSLAIVSGTDGARLSHSHERQYYFALQSLTLWRDIIDDMFRLWAMAEEDLLSDAITYALQDTGQGHQRVQQSPRTYATMQTILARVQHKVQHWVGSSVIHMGDHNVPNSLSFIDKYTQVPRILGPIVACLENLEKIYEKDPGVQKLIDDGFGGLEKVRHDILYDFFRSAFDGSGADNFYDAGSCIDGRLTSAWNWCSQLPNKPFYLIFKLTGFTGFDGEFK